MKDELHIELSIDKEPYINTITDDNIINLTGQSGSGKSTYAKEHFNTKDYLIVDTDDIFSDIRFKKSKGINKKLGKYFRTKYKQLPTLSNDFDLIYKEILDYTRYLNKIVVIDCAQFHSIKDITILKGKIIVIRTSIDTCYKRVIERYKSISKNYTEEELNNYKERKKGMYEWYKGSNKFIDDIDLFIKNKNNHINDIKKTNK